VIIAINEVAFKTTPYPLILSFENHCTPRQQVNDLTIFGQRIIGVFSRSVTWGFIVLILSMLVE